NPRLADSVRHQDLAAFGVICNGARVAEAAGGGALRRIANYSLGGDVAIGGPRENDCRMVVVIAYPYLIVLLIYGNAHWVVQSGPGAPNNPDRSGVPLVGPPEDQYRVGPAVGNGDFIVYRVHIQSHWPVQFGMRSLNGAGGLNIPLSRPGVYGDRRG